MKAEYGDKEVINLFTHGGPVVGELHRAGIGVPIKPDADMPVKELRAARLKKNKTLIAALKEDPYSRSLLESCREDAAKGRMAPLRLAHECDLSSMTLSPRFAVKQGASFVLKRTSMSQTLSLTVRPQAGWEAETPANRRYVEVGERFRSSSHGPSHMFGRAGRAVTRPQRPVRSWPTSRWTASCRR